MTTVIKINAIGLVYKLYKSIGLYSFSDILTYKTNKRHPIQVMEIPMISILCNLSCNIHTESIQVSTIVTGLVPANNT